MVTPLDRVTHPIFNPARQGLTYTRDRDQGDLEKTMETEKYVTLFSGTANNNQFMVMFNETLKFGDQWEVAVAQAHVPHGPLTLADAFNQHFPNNPVLGQLKTFFKTSARNDLAAFASGQKSVRLNDILGEFSETTSKFNVLKLIYTLAWNGIATEKTPGKGMHLRMNNQDFIAQVFKETSRGVKLEGTAFFGGYLSLNKKLGQMIGVWNAAGTGLGNGVRHEARSLADMRFRTMYGLSGDQILLYNDVDWYFPLSMNPWPSSVIPKTTPQHVDIHCDAVETQQSNGQILLHAEVGGMMTPMVWSYVTLAKTEVNQIKVWITESGTSTLATLPNEKTRITLHFRKNGA